MLRPKSSFEKMDSTYPLSIFSFFRRHEVLRWTHGSPLGFQSKSLTDLLLIKKWWFQGLGEGEKVCICAPKRPCLRPAGGLEEVKEVLENPQDLQFEKECRKCQMAWPRGENHDVLREERCQGSGGPAGLLRNLDQRIKKIQQIRQKLLE